MVRAARTPFESLLHSLSYSDFLAHVSIHPIHPAQRSTHRSLITTKSLSTGEVILRIPPEHLLSSSLGRSTDAIRVIIDAAPDNVPDAKSNAAALQLVIIYNFRMHGMKEWVAFLPDEITTPTTADGNLIEEYLCNTPLLPAVTTIRTQLREVYDKWIHPVTHAPSFSSSSLAKITYEEFLRAHAIVESRAFKLESDTVIAPLADMMNHSPVHNAMVRPWRIDDIDGISQAGIEVVAMTDLKEGEEILIRYGELSNWQLLLHWGFCLPLESNPFERLDLCLEQPEDARYIVVLALQGIDQLEFSLSYSDPLPDKMVAACRILVADDEELKEGAKRNWGFMATERNERMMIDVLRRLITALRPSEEEMVDGVLQPSEPTLEFWCTLYQRGIHKMIKRSLRQVSVLEESI